MVNDASSSFYADRSTVKLTDDSTEISQFLIKFDESIANQLTKGALVEIRGRILKVNGVSIWMSTCIISLQRGFPISLISLGLRRNDAGGEGR